MDKKIEFLDPKRKLVEEVVDWLCTGGRVRTTPEGAYSLAHIMVVVPTAQSGRQLRLKLAKKAAAAGWGGILPPRVVLPIQLIEPETSAYQVASTVQLRAAFLKFIAERPRRKVVEGRHALEEWTHLFQPEYILDFKTHLSFLDQLNDIWRILAGGGLLMRDVPGNEKAAELLAAAVGDEAVRWEELADFETAFFDFLHVKGLMHEVEGIHLAKLRAKPVEDGIEEIVLPALVDPVSVLYDVLEQQADEIKVSVLVQAEASAADKFDTWGRPVVGRWIGSNRPVLESLRDEDIVRAATDTEIATFVAEDFPDPDSGVEPPSLGLCDAELFPELSAAFLNRGYVLHNPERHRIAISSLGRMLDNLLSIYQNRGKDYPWEEFVSLMREDDVLKALCPWKEGGDASAPRRIKVLEGIDICRNAFLPDTMPRSCSFDLAQVRRWEVDPCEQFLSAARTFTEMTAEALADHASPAEFLCRMLRKIYARRALANGEGEKEFLAAAKVVRNVLGEFSSEVIGGLALNENALVGLVRKTLTEASYSLEPDSRHALKTEGWLELCWSDAERIALAGFNEGNVPDSVIGHAFIPDSLRNALGLTSNEQRLARDTYLLSNILASRSEYAGRVRAYVALANNAGDIRRPSRLLFLVRREELASRTRHLFGELPAGKVRPPRVIAPDWRPRLPAEGVELPGQSRELGERSLSASGIDEWLKCPFTYLFKFGLGMEHVEEKVELGADDFGTFVHKALELYAREQLDRTNKGERQLFREEEIGQSIVAIVDELAKRYGSEPAVRLRLQLDAVRERLRCFAKIQAYWAEQGWEVACEPECRFEVRPFAGEGEADVVVKGSVDRIDRRRTEGGYEYRLIDYKTWDRRDGVAGRILKGGAQQIEHARRLRLPLLAADPGKERRLLSVQLPLYGRCLETKDPETFAGRIADYCYLVLGKNADNIKVFGSACGHGELSAQSEAPGQAWRRVKLADYVDLSLDTARTAIRRIRANVFWPAGPGKLWKYDVKDVLMTSPEKDFPVGTPWRDAQERKLEELA